MLIHCVPTLYDDIDKQTTIGECPDSDSDGFDSHAYIGDC
jgi:hypothetical protein